VPDSQFPPSGLAGARRGRVLVVVHEQVELLDVDQDRLGVRRRDPLPLGGAAAGPAGPHVAEEVQHQLGHPGRVGGQPGLADAPSLGALMRAAVQRSADGQLTSIGESRKPASRPG
jgi:hypothetical protein